MSKRDDGSASHQSLGQVWLVPSSDGQHGEATLGAQGTGDSLAGPPVTEGLPSTGVPVPMEVSSAIDGGFMGPGTIEDLTFADAVTGPRPSGSRPGDR